MLLTVAELFVNLFVYQSVGRITGVFSPLREIFLKQVVLRHGFKNQIDVRRDWRPDFEMLVLGHQNVSNYLFELSLCLWGNCIVRQMVQSFWVSFTLTKDN